MRIAVTFSFSVEVNGQDLLTRQSWNRRRNAIKKRDGAICRYCGKKAPRGQVDHIVPLSKGGTDDPVNLAWSCGQCNGSKGNKMLQEWKPTTGTQSSDDLIMPPFEQCFQMRQDTSGTMVDLE